MKYANIKSEHLHQNGNAETAFFGLKLNKRVFSLFLVLFIAMAVSLAASSENNPENLNDEVEVCPLGLLGFCIGDPLFEHLDAKWDVAKMDYNIFKREVVWIGPSTDDIKNLEKNRKSSRLLKNLIPKLNEIAVSCTPFYLQTVVRGYNEKGGTALNILFSIIPTEDEAWQGLQITHIYRDYYRLKDQNKDDWLKLRKEEISKILPNVNKASSGIVLKEMSHGIRLIIQNPNLVTWGKWKKPLQFKGNKLAAYTELKAVVEKHPQCLDASENKLASSH